MPGDIHRFDPSTYDAKSVNKPLAQIMREAERERSETGARIVADLFRSFIALFRRNDAAAPAAPAAKTGDRRLAA